MQERSLDAFKNFTRRTAIRTPQNEQSFKNSVGRFYSSIKHTGYTKEEIVDILESGNVESIRALSEYFARFSGIYARIKQYYSSLLSYAYMVVPHYDVDKPPKKNSLMASYKKTASYIKDMNLDFILPKINDVIFTSGVYYGILRDSEDGKPVFYQLPSKFCRTRFNDEYGLPVLELNLSYFDQVSFSDAERRQILNLFPKRVQQAYGINSKDSILRLDRWVEISAADGGMCFFFTEDCTPPFVSASDAIADLETARNRERERDNNELYKLLIQKLPIDKSTGELLFSLEEAAELHSSVTNMLADNDTIDVLTTYADITLENVQDGDDAASASNSRLGKYKDSVYDEFGTPSAIFNGGDGSTAITYSIKKDIAIMFNWSKKYQMWLNAWLRTKAKKESLYFTIQFLPTSSIFRSEDIDAYLKTAQYGYPKSALASAMGIDTLDLMNLAHFENEMLDLPTRMIPVQSSYTQTGEENSKSGEKNSQRKTSSANPSNEGGRPAKSVEDRSDKTNRNIDGKT